STYKTNQRHLRKERQHNSLKRTAVLLSHAASLPRGENLGTGQAEYLQCGGCELRAEAKPVERFLAVLRVRHTARGAQVRMHLQCLRRNSLSHAEMTGMVRPKRLPCVRQPGHDHRQVLLGHR